MTEPLRLVGETPTEFERWLLDAARGERPSEELEQRMLAPVAFGAAATGTAAATTGMSLGRTGSRWSMLGKWGLGVVSAGLVASGVWLWLHRPDVDGSALERSSTQLAQPGQAASKAAEHQAPPSVYALPADYVAPVAQAPGPNRVSAKPATRDASASLHEEVLLLEKARQALASGSTSTALSLLSQYDARYPTGQLRQEATVLRVQALEARGKPTEANELAADFLQKNPESAHAPRIERETGVTPKAGSQSVK